MRVPTVALAAHLLALASLTAAEPERPSDERLLRSHRIPVDEAGLVEYLKNLVPKRATQAEIDKAVGLLGAEAYRVREDATNKLIGYGAIATPALQQAMKSDDLEVSRRAERCLEAIKLQRDDQVLGAVFRQIEERTVTGAQLVLIELLPHLGSVKLEDEARYALMALVRHEPKGTGKLLPALTDKEPLRRGAAALALGRFGNGEQREAVRALFTDKEPSVRLCAAEGLLAARERAALPVLIELLDNAELAPHAQDLLSLVVGPTAPARADLKDNQVAWKQWWEANAKRTDLLDKVDGILDVDARARRAAYRFALALKNADLDKLKELTDVPFRMSSNMIDRAELDKLLTQAAGFVKQQRLQVELTFERRTQPFHFPGFTKEVPWANDTIRVLRFRMKITPKEPEQQGYLYLRFKEGAVHIVGFSEDRGQN